jgi:DNA-directed RNA polymerase II subunit RPB1
MNIHAPQTYQACMELAELMSVEKHVISPNACPSFGFVQNSLLGSHMITRDDVFLTKPQMFDMMMMHETGFSELPIPAVFTRDRVLWYAPSVTLR